MNKRYILITIVVATALLTALAAIIPIASRTVTSGCPIAPDDARTIRYSIVRGHTVADIEAETQTIEGQGCTPNHTRTLYIL